MTKTLEELKKELVDILVEWEGQSNPLMGAFRVDARVKSIEPLLKKAFNLAIDTAIGNLPKEWPEVFKDEQEAKWKRGYDSYREEALQTLLKMKV